MDLGRNWCSNYQLARFDEYFFLVASLVTVLLSI